MDKLYDLMVMGFKQQMMCVQYSEEIVFVTLTHLHKIRALVHTQPVIQIVDDTIKMVKDTYGRFSMGDMHQLRHILCNFYQDKHIKVPPRSKALSPSP